MIPDELNKYTRNDHFFFQQTDSLREVCNASKNSSGVYLIYALAQGRIELVYIGSSGVMTKDGQFHHRNGGLFERIVNDKVFEKKRTFSYTEKMEEEEIEVLDIYWFDTFNNIEQDIPHCIEGILIQNHYDLFGQLPRWNQEY